jgi:hypothetical protein
LAAAVNVDAVAAFDKAIDPPILIFDACDVPLRVVFPDRYNCRPVLSSWRHQIGLFGAESGPNRFRPGRLSDVALT